MSINLPDFAETYRQEAAELLAELEETLLEMETAPDDPELIGRTFRALHTIKGSGAMNGFDEIARFTHEIETLFDQVRGGTLQVDREIVDIGLGAKDHIRDLLAGGASPEPGVALCARARTVMGGEQEPGATLETKRHGANVQGPVTYRIRFRPEPTLFLNGTNPLPLLNELRGLGQALIFANADAIPALDEIDPESCLLWWDIVLTTSQGVDAIRDVFIFVDDRCELEITPVDAPGDGEETDYKKLGYILVERGDLSTEQMDAAVAAQKRFGEILEERGLVAPKVLASALAEQKMVRDNRQKRSEETTSIRVPVDKLTVLVNLVGELVTAQARLSRTSNASGDTDLHSVAEELERLVASLRDTALSIRMLPIGTTFSRFRRVVRDLSTELGKEIELETSGAEVELDKTMIERLADPLVHLIRNSVDHGIESPQERIEAGKPRAGTITLSASHSEAHVVVSITDDGAGIDADKVRAKAIKNGLIHADDPRGPHELYRLIFEPGFSTAKAVTSVSGRGVGMDVVKRSVESLRGSVGVTSELGKGTTVTLKLPLTLAIIEGLLVKVRGARYVVPLGMVDECMDLEEGPRDKSHSGREIVEVRGHVVPYISLRRFFHEPGEAPRIQQLVVTRADGHGFGVVVDEVEGQVQAVIKNLGRMYEEVEGFSGATILGDGTVALILDVPALCRRARQEEMEAVGSSR